MTLGELRIMLSRFVTDLYYDNYAGTNPDSAELTSQINWAIRGISEYTWCNYHPKISLDLAENDFFIDCRGPKVERKIIQPITVTIAGSVLCGPDGKPGMWSMADLKRFHPGFQTYDAAEPTKAVWLPNNKLLLSSPCDSATALLETNFIEGVYLASDMTDSVDDNNSPDIPEEMHEMIAYFAAQRAIMPEISDAQGWQKVAAYRSDWMQMADSLKSTNRQAIIGPSSIRGTDSDWMVDSLWT